MALFLSVSLLSIHTGASAQSRIYSLDIPPQALSVSLRELSQAVDYQIVFASDVVSGFESPVVRGNYSVREALEVLLAGTPLRFEIIDTGLITISSDREQKTVDTPPVIAAAKTLKDLANLEVLEVTGSRIKRPDFELLYPTMSIGSEIFFQSSKTNIGDVLNDFPITCDGQFSLGRSGLERGIGDTYPDLYCLGSQRTLTLVNGHRIAGTNEVSPIGSEEGGQFDINSVGRNILDRVEIVGVGGAPVYGADAVAGAVNVILRNDVEGVELDIQHGRFEKGSEASWLASIAAGNRFFSERFGLTASYEYHQQDEVKGTAREYSALDREYIFYEEDGQEVAELVDNYRIPLDSQYGTPIFFGLSTRSFEENFDRFAVRDGAGNRLVFNAEGQLVPQGGAPSQELGVYSGGIGDRRSLRRSLRVPTTRHIANIFADLEFDHTRVFGELLFYQLESKNPTPGALNDLAVYPISDPVFDTQTRTLLENTQARYLDEGANLAEDLVLIQRDLGQLAGESVDSRTQIGRIVLGIEGDFSLGPMSAEWKVSGNRGRSKSKIFDTDFYACEFTDATTREAGEEPSACPNVEGELNLERALDRIPFFGAYSDQTIERVRANSLYENQSDQSVISALMRGDVLIPGGESLAFAFGFERRHDSAHAFTDEFNSIQLDPDNPNLRGLGYFNGVASTRGAFTSNEAFAEIIVPLISPGEVPLIDTFQAEAALRVLDHEFAGRDLAWTAGAKLGLNLNNRATLTFRGNNTASVRAPAINEIFSPISSVSFSGAPLVDPCSSPEIDNSRDPLTRRARCENEAVQLGLSDIDFDSLRSSVNNTAFIGNRRLDNEKGRGTTFGTILEIDKQRNRFAMSIDYIDIEVLGTIGFDAQRSLDACYDFENSAECGITERDSNDFSITLAAIPSINVGALSTRLYQFNATKRYTTDYAGRWQFALQGRHLKRYIDPIGNDLRGLFGFPVNSLRTSVSVDFENIEIALSSQYGSATESFNSRFFSFQLVDGGTISARTTHDLALQFMLSPNITWRMGVKNISNWQPSGAIPSSEAVGRYAPLGREFVLGMNARF